jgi:predicted RNA-binding Zn ribbon-like protein
MARNWTDKQFVGGTVALDFANTVCYRGDPFRCFDKIDGGAELERFAAAARVYSDARRWPRAAIEATPLALVLCREIRSLTDTLFRGAALVGSVETEPLRSLLRLHQDLLAGQSLAVGDGGIELAPGGRPSFALVLTQSALELAASPDLRRLKICPSCRWLFIDRSRNASRLWCDMLTCGNQAKARRHHARRRDENHQKLVERLQ